MMMRPNLRASDIGSHFAIQASSTHGYMFTRVNTAEAEAIASGTTSNISATIRNRARVAPLFGWEAPWPDACFAIAYDC